MRAGCCQGKERHGPCRLTRCLSWHRGPACARVLAHGRPCAAPRPGRPCRRGGTSRTPAARSWLGVGASSALLNGALHAHGDVPPSRDWPPCPECSLRRPCDRALSDPVCPGACHLFSAAGPQPAVGSCSARGLAPGPAEHLGQAPVTACHVPGHPGISREAPSRGRAAQLSGPSPASGPEASPSSSPTQKPSPSLPCPPLLTPEPRLPGVTPCFQLTQLTAPPPL